MLGRPQDWPYRNGERNSIAFTEGKRIKYYVLTRHQTFIKLSSNFYQTFIKLPSKLPSWKHSKISKNLNSLAVHCSTRMLDFSIHSSWAVFRRKLATGGPWIHGDRPYMGLYLLFPLSKLIKLIKFEPTFDLKNTPKILKIMHFSLNGVELTFFCL